ncbi:D-alanyl-D-alanine carboxypeptidase family protein [Neobacillus niacini]|jgi:zinc D-Ala-D-Ala carboxypeptidase|uniref:M15 family metallopeptidase n=1 Tax=Neobacillus niacini TaxID=86668 RepID=UPI001C8F0A46|nr:M15 family metallopeptidase [Neobacillus niacini]MBY0145985.1 M15 family metallopeptidase [Neobacillus niacini]
MIWKNVVMIGSMTLLFSGCSQINSLVDKLPFASNDSSNNNQQTQQEEIPIDDPLSLESIFFNDIKEVDGKNVIQNSTNVMALVNKEFFFPADYVPDDLVKPDVAFSFKDIGTEKSLMRRDAAKALEIMFKDAAEYGIELYAVSGYRSYVRQKSLYDAEVERVGSEKAEQAVAIPGASEHQSGLAMDISSKSNRFYLNTAFANTPEGKWLKENAHRFGFILRYPKEKTAITNYMYEPWHFRYVGEKAARIMYEHNWTLEEYFNEVKKI